MHSITRQLGLLAAAYFAGVALAQQPAAEQVDGAVPLPPGWIVIEGDIVVPDDYFQLRGTYSTNLWSGGVVPYVFNANVNSTNQQRALDAMAEWEAVANVNFVPRTSQPDYLFIQNNTVNNSAVGQTGGPQIVNISAWTSRFVIVHELGHALGYWHEQSRADRDLYINVEFDNICDACCSGSPCDYNFSLRPPGGAGEYGPYDFDSVMHYGACAFSACTSCVAGDVSCRTISVLLPNTAWQSQIGQRDHLSKFDALTMSFLYPESDWRFVDVDWTGTEAGTFLAPFQTALLGFSSVPDGGTVWIQPGDYLAAGTWSDAMTVVAPLGGVTLGLGGTP